MRKVILVLVLVTMTGCASIVSKSDYPVTFNSNPTGAMLLIRDMNGNIIFEGTAPTTLTLSAKNRYFSGARYEVEAILPGYDAGNATVISELDGWYLGNIVFGGLIGLLIVDPASGAMWKLNDQVTVNLEESSGEEDGSDEAYPPTVATDPRQLHILTLDQVPADVREHLVRVQ